MNLRGEVRLTRLETALDGVALLALLAALVML